MFFLESRETLASLTEIKIKIIARKHGQKMQRHVDVVLHFLVQL